MRKLSLILMLFISTLSFASDGNTRFGAYGNDTGYKYESGNADMGRLIIFTCPLNIRCNNPYPILSMTPYFLIRINGSQLAEIYGNDYFDINLPIGLYKVDVVSYNDFGEDSVAMSYEVLIKRNRSITIYTRNHEDGSYTSMILTDPNKLIDSASWGMKWKKAQIDEQALSSLSSTYINNVKNVLAQEEEEEEEARTSNIKTDEGRSNTSKYDAKIYDAKIEEARLRIEKESAFAEKKKIEQEENKKQVLIKNVQKKTEQEEKSQSKADDATCKSYGAKFGSAVYVQCRTQLTSQRSENIESLKTIEVLEKKIDSLQTQLNTQQQTFNSNVSSTSQDRNIELTFQKEQLAIQQEQLRVLKAQNERAKAESALRYIQQQNNPGLWGNPTNVRIVP